MSEYKLTDKQELELCRLYVEENIKSPELSRIFNITTKTVSDYLKKNNIKIKRVEINPGDKFGRWTVIEEVEKRGSTRYFLCECSCDKKTRREVKIWTLRNGTSKSCGCYHKEKVSNSDDIIGLVYGKLTIIKELERNKNGRKVLAQCSCDGNIGEYWLDSLKRGSTKSCGCIKTGPIRYQLKDYQDKYPLFCMVENIRDGGDGIEVECKHCKSWFFPTNGQLQRRIGIIEKPGTYSIGTELNFYCSDECKKSCVIYNLHSNSVLYNNLNRNDNDTPTSHELRIWREEVLKRQRNEYGYNFCVKCQSISDLKAHHIDPQKLTPFFSLDPENGFVICIDCHDEFHKGECSTGALANKICK